MPSFRTVARYASDGCLLKPLLTQFFTSPDAFRMTIRTAKPLDRAPDDWFHASTHPGLSEAELVTYLRGETPSRPDDFGYVGRMSVMFGTIMHEVTRQALGKLKLMVPVDRGWCAACGLKQPTTCREHGLCQKLTRSRGHMDGILDFSGTLRNLRAFRDVVTGEFVVEVPQDIYGFDLKTIKPMILSKAPDMDLEFFRGKWPHYWWQMQEYMRLSGLRSFIVLFIALGNPWDVREYHIPFDSTAAFEIESKYTAALKTAGLW
jgi:hypothetical protein